ncbi:MAG: glycerate kinase [Cyclobacteriaceae bacterium]|nr:glycerate kinase [Cyclobacteriaceae bacterium]
MNILVATDKFKGTLSAKEVCAAIAAGFRNAGVDYSVREIPLADGGDGTLDFFVAQGGQVVKAVVHDPLMRPIPSALALSADGTTAYIEMARCSGLLLLRPEEYNPVHTTSFGVGELIRTAIHLGATHIILGIGGSATNDAGIGMLAALGYRFLDQEGRELFPSGKSLKQVDAVEGERRLPALDHVRFTALCDVTNPFYGRSGAAWVYGPQKGATPAMVNQLDDGLQHLADLIRKSHGIDLQQIPGSGAGGGIAGGAHVWLGAELRPGIDVIFDFINFEEAVSWADVIITGEGKVDDQTLQGKVVAGVMGLAKQQGKQLLILCGQAHSDAKEIDAPVFSLAEAVGMDRAVNDTSNALREVVIKKLIPALLRS